jgi:hypothetical protein
MIYGAIGGAIYLGLIYPVFRMFHPSHRGSTEIVLWGQGKRAFNNYGFGPDWTCQHQNGALICFRNGAPATAPHP